MTVNGRTKFLFVQVGHSEDYENEKHDSDVMGGRVSQRNLQDTLILPYFNRAKIEFSFTVFVVNLETHCSEISPVAHGDTVTSSPPPYKVGTTVNFACDIGFRKSRESTLTCLSNGEWSDKQPYCICK